MKKSPKKLLAPVIAEERPNKHRSYIKITHDDKKGVYQIESS